MHSEAQKSEYYMCKYCLDTAALTISEIVEHYKEYHEGYALPYFQCENCDFYSNKFSDTKEHLKQGNFLRGIDNKTFRRLGYFSVFTHVFFSAAHSF